MTTDKSKNFFRVSAEDFKKIPGSPIAYWLSDSIIHALANYALKEKTNPRMGLTTGNNGKYVRFWFEVTASNIGFGYTRSEAQQSKKIWFPYDKGGEFRKWYGNRDFVVNWYNDGFEMQNTMHPDGTRIWAHNFNLEYNFLPHISWNDICTNNLSFRFFEQGFLFDSAAATVFCESKSEKTILAFCNSSFVQILSKILNPTIHFKLNDFEKLPYNEDLSGVSDNIVTEVIGLSKNDWDSYEASWDFRENPLCVSPQERAEQLSYGIHSEERAKAVSLISERYMRLRCDWQRQTEEMRNLEIENNRIFIDAYGLQDELSPEVPWNEITLTCNPWYRYGKSPQEISVASDQCLVASNSEQQKTNHWTLATSHSRESMPMDSALEQRLLEDTNTH